jgi:hypothetical protein
MKQRFSLSTATPDFPAINLNLSPKWAGVTHSTDRLIAKTILGYRFDF